MLNDFEEQIDKEKFYEQQSGGKIDVKLYRRLPRQRGYGVISSVAKRFAFPVFRNLFKYAKPLAKGLFSEVKTTAKDTIRDVAVKKLQDLTEKLNQSASDMAQTGNGLTHPIIVNSPKPRKRKKRQRKTAIKTTKKKTTKNKKKKKAPKKIKNVKHKQKTSRRKQSRKKTKFLNAKSFDIFR